MAKLAQKMRLQMLLMDYKINTHLFMKNVRETRKRSEDGLNNVYLKENDGA